MAIGVAVLASTLFAPHRDHWSVLDGVRWKYQSEAYETTRKGNPFDQFDDLVTQTIYVTGHGMFEFPRKMTPDQIRDVLQKKFPSEQEIVSKAVNARAPRWDETAPIDGLASKADDLGFVPDTTANFDPDAFLAKRAATVTVYHPDWVNA